MYGWGQQSQLTRHEATCFEGHGARETGRMLHVSAPGSTPITTSPPLHSNYGWPAAFQRASPDVAHRAIKTGIGNATACPCLQEGFGSSASARRINLVAPAARRASCGVASMLMTVTARRCSSAGLQTAQVHLAQRLQRARLQLRLHAKRGVARLASALACLSAQLRCARQMRITCHRQLPPLECRLHKHKHATR